MIRGDRFQAALALVNQARSLDELIELETRYADVSERAAKSLRHAISKRLEELSSHQE